MSDLTKDRNEGFINYIEEIVRPVRVLYVSTYIPRKCGIATFTKDLTNAINMLNPLYLAEIAALDNHFTNNIEYPHEVKFRLDQENWEDYRQLADFVNSRRGPDLVCLQHEYGIFGGEDGELIVDFLKRLKRPVVTTLHTVPLFPNKHQAEILNEICRLSSGVVVMLKCLRTILKERYFADEKKIAFIPHGVPDFPRLDIGVWKKRKRLSKYVVMSSINLISPSKGLEYGIEAVSKIVKTVPNFLYIIIGQSHPVYLKENDGKDPYRKKLLKLVRDLGVEKNVKFVNRYITISELIEFIGASDFYITPYPHLDQAASGALAYAIGAGKACISTPYLYAKEIIGEERGVLIPPKDSKAIERSVIKLLNKPRLKEKCEVKAYEVGRTMTWINVGHRYYHFFNLIQNGYPKKR